MLLEIWDILFLCVTLQTNFIFSELRFQVCKMKTIKYKKINNGYYLLDSAWGKNMKTHIKETLKEELHWLDIMYNSESNVIKAKMKGIMIPRNKFCKFVRIEITVLGSQKNNKWIQMQIFLLRKMSKILEQTVKEKVKDKEHIKIKPL